MHYRVRYQGRWVVTQMEVVGQPEKWTASFQDGAEAVNWLANRFGAQVSLFDTGSLILFGGTTTDG